MSEGIFIYRNGWLLVFLNQCPTMLCLAKKERKKKEKKERWQDRFISWSRTIETERKIAGVIPSKTFKISNEARSLMTRNTSCSRTKRSTFLWTLEPDSKSACIPPSNTFTRTVSCRLSLSTLPSSFPYCCVNLVPVLHSTFSCTSTAAEVVALRTSKGHVWS